MANLIINPTVFERIIDHEIPAERVYEDGEMLAIKDINPIAPLHIIIFPKRRCKGLDEVQASDTGTIGRMVLLAAKIAEDAGYAADGYRVVFNTNASGGQTVFHLHLHLIAGRQMGPMG